MDTKLTNHVRQVYEKATCLYTKKDVEKALDQMALEISEKVGDKSPVFLCVLIGGIIPLGNLLTRLDFPLEIDYVHVGRYGNNSFGAELNWKACPRTNLKDRTVVIVDDILDEGVTFALIKQYCKEQGAKEIFTAALLDKKKARAPEGIKDVDFKGLVIDDKFVFGYGLDYQEYLRNAPGIYVVSSEHLGKSKEDK
jgi:hypoxanthine phosphoribosyltransferase